jgi:CBS-domain-containing membrane protein
MLAVRDIMQTDVVTVSTDTTARYLARLLADEEISGVPVIDASGALAGVVSSTDLVRLAADDSGVRLRATGPGVGVDPIRDSGGDEDDSDTESDPFGFFLPEDSPFTGQRFLEQWPDGDFDTVTVSEIMTPISFAVEPDTPLAELCQFLVRGRIHRAVVKKNGELLGIVTSADVLRAVADGRMES